MIEVAEAFERVRVVLHCLPDGMLASLASGALLACSAWVLMGWDKRDVREVLLHVRRFACGEAGLLARALDRVAGRIGKRLGMGSHVGNAVSLGAVSEMIDIVRLGLKAGLSFDASLGLYCEGRPGVLSERLACARLSWQMGLATREHSLLNIAHELGLRPLESFSIAVAQALELGAPLANTLEGQGREIRAAHRADVERQIERAPVKLLIPTGTLILPALLLSIVGPLVAAGGLM